jgi:hypothetical protein
MRATSGRPGIARRSVSRASYDLMWSPRSSLPDMAKSFQQPSWDEAGEVHAEPPVHALS